MTYFRQIFQMKRVVLPERRYVGINDRSIRVQYVDQRGMKEFMSTIDVFLKHRARKGHGQFPKVFQDMYL